MDLFLIIVGALLLLVGVAGSVIPVLPGIPLCWLGYFLLKFTDQGGAAISWQQLIILAIVVVVITVLDNMLPIWGAKKQGGSKLVMVLATVGLIMGLFLGPIGVFLGPFLGALLGALIDGNTMGNSISQALGTFLGIFVGIVMKLCCAGYIVWCFIRVLL